jgi:hypothetical protein
MPLQTHLCSLHSERLPRAAPEDTPDSRHRQAEDMDQGLAHTNHDKQDAGEPACPRLHAGEAMEGSAHCADAEGKRRAQLPGGPRRHGMWPLQGREPSSLYGHILTQVPVQQCGSSYGAAQSRWRAAWSCRALSRRTPPTHWKKLRTQGVASE